MELSLKNSLQCKIAELLWKAQTQKDVQEIITIFGHDARVVYEMMVAATFDDVSDLTEAQQALTKIFV